MKQLINFTLLLVMLLLIERLSYSVWPVFRFWFGLISGVLVYGGYDLVNNFILNEYEL